MPCCVVGGSLDNCSQIQLGVRELNVHPIESCKECAALSFACRHDVFWLELQTRAEVEYKDATGCARTHCPDGALCWILCLAHMCVWGTREHALR